MFGVSNDVKSKYSISCVLKLEIEDYESIDT